MAHSQMGLVCYPLTLPPPPPGQTV